MYVVVAKMKRQTLSEKMMRTIVNLHHLLIHLICFALVNIVSHHHFGTQWQSIWMEPFGRAPIVLNDVKSIVQ